MKRYHSSAWHAHKARAAQRGIPFLLTFEEWLKIWNESGHFHERGRLKGQYCMARHDDVGPYAVGNVKIIRNEENRAEQRLSDETRAKMRAAKLGVRQSESHRQNIANALRGRVDPPEVRAKKSAAKMGPLNPMFGKPIPPDVLARQVAARTGQRRSDETKRKISEARKRYWEARK